MPIIDSRKEGNERLLRCLQEAWEFVKNNSYEELKFDELCSRYRVSRAITKSLARDVITAMLPPTMKDAIEIRKRRKVAKTECEQSVEQEPKAAEVAAVTLLKSLGYKLYKPVYSEI